MARTRNPATHAVRRDAFVDAAQRLIATKGYEAFSVQDVLDELDASKGAFYHYFGSKGDLLEAVVERMADAVEASWGAVMARTDLTAAERLQGIFETSAAYKNARRDLSLAILEAWLADTNAVTRDKLRAMVRSRMSTVLATIIREGIASGEFTATDPDGHGERRRRTASSAVRRTPPSCSSPARPARSRTRRWSVTSPRSAKPWAGSSACPAACG